MLKLRFANHADAELLFRWRKDPCSIANSRAHHVPTWPQHAAWVDAIIAAPDRCLLIAEIDRQPVGWVRFEPHGTDTEMSWHIAEEYRGHCLGRVMVEKAMRWSPARNLIAEIRAENTKSKCIATGAGFKLDQEIDNLARYALRATGS
jgi:RimJ/RimL family protein N-acetyltransferase